MIAAILTRPGNFELKQVAIPEIAANEVRIKVEGCGICASSIPLWEGREWFNYPIEPGSPGHEGWGIVDDIGSDVRDISKGDRVAFLSFHAYAEYDKAPASEVTRLPDALRDAPFPGEPLGCAMNIFERSDVTGNDTVAIVGGGFLGVLLCQLCKDIGAKVIMVSRRKYSLAMAEQYGATETIQLTDAWNVANAIQEITGKAFCSRVIEATGKQEGLDAAGAIIAEGGKMIIAGYHQDGLRQVNMQQWNWKGIDVINAHERQTSKYIRGMEKAIDAVISGRIKPSGLYTNILKLEELGKGFELTKERPDGFMKALIEV